jgi:hypothetical protein
MFDRYTILLKHAGKKCVDESSKPVYKQDWKI